VNPVEPLTSTGVANSEPLPVSVSGRDWTEVATKLNRLLHWEFEDYQS
jgi:Immunity protein 8